MLSPLSLDHLGDLQEACEDGQLYNLWYTMIPRPEDMKAEIERRLALQKTGAMLPFSVQTPDGKTVGMTTFMNVDATNRRVEIGSTWYRKAVQRSFLNTEAKLMMLTHAFEQKSSIAVEFRTHFVNSQSRNAIERLGARFDGVLRNHMIMANGTIRDTAVYSIIKNEWPTVKAHLAHKLSHSR